MKNSKTKKWKGATKECVRCGEVKDKSQFSADKRAKSGLKSYCKACCYKIEREWAKKNLERVKVYRSKYSHNYYMAHKKERNEKRKERRRSEPSFRLRNNMSSLINYSLRGGKGWKRWEDLLGYTMDDLRARLESKFDDKMTWENYGGYWHIDHIKPISLFNFSSVQDEEFKKCWALDNFQPLEAKENIRKGNMLRYLIGVKV